ncbi:MAG TPA: class I SAM-dependent methyltransferase [Caulobacteraceae bacterium]
MDYDTTTMPAVCDAGRGYSPQELARWLARIEHAAGRARPIGAILDLGCGTGRYSGPLARHFGAEVIAIDPSEQMLAQARAKAAPGVTWRQGAGEALPLEDASVDLVFMSMVFHHFNDPGQVARECRRVLRAGGSVVIRTADCGRVDEFSYVPFFPQAKPIIEAAIGRVATVEATFAGAGFAPTSHEVFMSETASNWSEYAERVSLRADSILVQLSEAAFAEGLAALRAYAAAHPADGPVAEPVDLLAFRRA